MWTAHQYLFELDELAWPNALDRATAALFRGDFSQPGFALLDLAATPSPFEFRRLLLKWINRLSDAFRLQTGASLEIVSVNRFDQQATTRPHLDGAPVESFLLLGYEPTSVSSDLALLDYSRYAREHGLTVRQFLDRFNPWTIAEFPGLDAYFTKLTEFESGHFQVLLVNNSSAEFGVGQQGVMHQADILTPDPNQSRVINSIVLAPPDPTGSPRPTSDQLEQFAALGTPAAG